MKKMIMLCFLPLLGACASSSVSQKLTFVSFEEKPKPQELTSVGSIEGRTCTWALLGYELGLAPSVRDAFTNAVHQKEEGMLPTEQAKSKGTGGSLKMVRNVAVEEGGFNAWVLSRRCITVTGVGYR